MKHIELLVSLVMLTAGIMIGFFVEPVIGTGVILLGALVGVGDAVDFFAEEES